MHKAEDDPPYPQHHHQIPANLHNLYQTPTHSSPIMPKCTAFLAFSIKLNDLEDVIQHQTPLCAMLALVPIAPYVERIHHSFNAGNLIGYHIFNMGFAIYLISYRRWIEITIVWRSKTGAQNVLQSRHKYIRMFRSMIIFSLRSFTYFHKMYHVFFRD